MSKDITNLKGNDLWDALTSGEKIKSRKQTKKEKRESILTTKVYTPPKMWHEISVVLLVHKTNCKCGACYETPNPIKFIKRRRVTDGALHWRRLDEIQIFAEGYAENLPLEIAYETLVVDDCQRCFGIEKLLTGQSILKTSDVPSEVPAPYQPEYATPFSVDTRAEIATAKAAPPPSSPVPGFIPDAPLAEDEDLCNQQLEA